MDRKRQIDEKKLMNIIEHMPDAFAYHEITLDSSGKPTGYIFIDVNNAFEEMTGLNRKDILGKNVIDVMPGIENSEFNWIKTYAEVALTGKSITFREYSQPLDKWFEIAAFSSEKGYFSTVFREITSDINEKKALEKIIDVSEACFKNFGEKNVYDKIADAVKIISGAMVVGFNIYDESGINFKTVSLSGVSDKIKKIVKILGFIPLNKEWNHDLRRAELIENSEVTEFESLSKLVGNVLPGGTIRLVEKMFSTGKVYIAKIIKSEVMIGDFTIIMLKDENIENLNFIQILSGLTGQYLERQNAQNDLLNKTKELEGFFDVNLDLLCIADTEGNFLRINKEWSNVLGYSEDEILSRKYFDFVHPDDIEATIDIAKKLEKQEIVLNFINRYRAKDGSYRYIEWRSNPNGKLIYAAARDITEQKKTQELLLSEHKKMMTIFDNMEAVVYVVDMDTYEILYINNQGVFDLGDLTGEICWNKVHHDQTGVCDFCPIDNLKMQNPETSKKRHREYFNRISNKWYQCTDSVIRWTDGRNVKLTISLDISNRVKIEQERFIEQEKFKTTLLSVGDAIIATDDEGNITVMNKVAEALTEWTQDEVLGKPLDEVFSIIHERTRKKCDNPVKQILLTGETFGLENNTALVAKSGKIIPIEDSAAPIKGMDGGITGVVIVFRDYTQKREQLEKVEFLSYNDHLTGLFNRRYMEKSLRNLDKKENLPFAITVVDVNGLKLTNDAYGHEMGDKLLVAVAKLLREASRHEDIVVRAGGDEFVILHPKMNNSKAEEFKLKVNDMAAEVKLDSVIVSLAVGYDVKTLISQDIYEVRRQADNRMYKNKLKSGKYMRSQTIEAVLRNINNKYDSEQIHTEKVSQYCAEIGRAMGFSANQIYDLKTVGVLHDIGKTVISTDILNKSEKLTSAEISEIRRHPIIGYNILKGVEEYSMYADAVLYHHERWEGKGYPSGIKDKDIPVFSRIVSVADAYEAMTSNRPFQAIMSKDEAIEELIRCSGTQFDPEIVDVFINKVLN